MYFYIRNTLCIGVLYHGGGQCSVDENLQGGGGILSLTQADDLSHKHKPSRLDVKEIILAYPLSRCVDFFVFVFVFVFFLISNVLPNIHTFIPIRKMNNKTVSHNVKS